MNSPGTDLITEVPEFEGPAREALDNYYAHLEVATPEAKLAAMVSNLGHFDFYAYGGGETVDMRLRAAERLFLLEKGIPIQ